MNWWRHWFGPRLDPDMETRLTAWRRLPTENLHATLETSSLISVDVETSGLNARRDRLISIGAVEITRGRLVLGRGFHGILRQERASSRENVLLHGIGHADQAGGGPPPDLLVEFLEYVGKRPLIAFHAPFDQAFLKRAVRKHLGEPFGNPFLDLAMLLPGLFPPSSKRPLGLDDWLQQFGLAISNRHSADADALVSAELFLIALHQARRKGLQSVHSLIGLAEDQSRKPRPR